MNLEKPYYAVIFSSTKRDLDEAAEDAYNKTAERMFELATTMPGYLGVEGAYMRNGFSITVSYWESLEAIKHWRDFDEHSEARRLGKEEWYNDYTLRIAKVECEYSWKNQESDDE